MSTLTMPSALGEESSRIGNDLYVMTVALREPGIGRQEGKVKGLCQCDVASVVCRDVLPQRPQTLEQDSDRIALNAQCRKEVEGTPGHLRFKPSMTDEPT